MLPSQNDKDKLTQGLLSVINKLIIIIIVLVIGIIALPFVFYNSNKTGNSDAVKKDSVAKDATVYWMPPEISAIADAKLKAQVEYGKELIEHTSKYLGPHGSVLQISNGMNCQNCHLKAGTAVFGNNYGSVASLYPKFRARSGSIENIYKRVNDCFERSLNGKALDTLGKEMQAICAYISFVGSNVPKGVKAAGSGFKDLAYLDRAADPEKGQAIYIAKCQSCHQAEGSGLFNADSSEYIYPALWGKNSFNDGAGLYRISNIAKYVKYNMPNGATHDNPQLGDDEAWDVAAFVVAQFRPHINVPKDWPDISKKPVDHPFGPYTDAFPEKQHKFGPFKAIVAEQKKKEEAEKGKTLPVSKK